MKKLKLIIVGDGSAGRRYDIMCQQRGHRTTLLGPKDASAVKIMGRSDGIIIASPPAFHDEHLRYAVPYADVPILCEGPVTRKVHTRFPNMTASNWRFVASMREFDARIHDGRQIVSAHLYFDWDLYKWRPGTPIQSPCYYREGITNINLHEVDMALWMFGPAERIFVESTSTMKSLGMDAYAMLIKHKSGVLTTIQSSWHSAQYRRGCVVQFRDGTVEEIGWQSPAHDTEVNESYEAVLDTWLAAIKNWDLSVSPSLFDGYRAWNAINGVAI